MPVNNERAHALEAEGDRLSNLGHRNAAIDKYEQAKAERVKTTFLYEQGSRPDPMDHQRALTVLDDKIQRSGRAIPNPAQSEGGAPSGRPANVGAGGSGSGAAAPVEIDLPERMGPPRTFQPDVESDASENGRRTSEANTAMQRLLGTMNSSAASSRVQTSGAEAQISDSSAKSAPGAIGRGSAALSVSLPTSAISSSLSSPAAFGSISSSISGSISSGHQSSGGSSAVRSAIGGTMSSMMSSAGSRAAMSSIGSVRFASSVGSSRGS